MYDPMYDPKSVSEKISIQQLHGDSICGLLLWDDTIRTATLVSVFEYSHMSPQREHQNGSTHLGTASTT